MIDGNHRERFSQFMESKKSDGLNIDNWSVDSLENMVFQFSQQKNQSNLFNDDLTSIFFQEMSIAKKEHLKVPCKKPVIQKIELESRGFLKNPLVKYQISLDSKTITRSQQDFKWMIESLTKEFPCVVLPPVVYFQEEKQFQLEKE